MNEHVWVIDDDSAIRWVLDRALSQASIPITAFNTADQALHHLNDEAPLAIIWCEDRRHDMAPFGAECNEKVS